ncbi:MAG: hypothetical protein JW956_02090 [Calditrichaceae bacterium]|nr:hypothetical protein [Calditrichaceae bacterium]
MKVQLMQLNQFLSRANLFLNLIQRIAILLLSLLAFTYAQFQSTIDISSWYDNNLYRSPEKVDDIVTDFDLQLDYQPEKSNVNFYFNGNYLLYNENNTRSFYMNALGFNYTKAMDDDELHTFYMGIDWTFRVNNEEYNYYDFNQVYAYSNLSFNLDWFFLRSGLNYRYRNYANIPDLNNNQFYGFVQINKPFETKTTFIIEANLGYKAFAGENFTSYTTSGDGSGQGHGRMSTTSTYTTAATTANEIPSLSQAVLLARVAQSLHTKIGVYAQYRKQISLTDETSYVNSDDYYQDEELFDDPFSYESDTYSSQFTWMLPWQMKLQIGGAITSKNYVSEAAYESIEDTTGSSIRVDDQNSYYVNFTKTFYLKKNWIHMLQFNLNYNYIRNESNSYWYDYENAVISSSIQWTF